jgi:hypothetical protein
MEYTGITDLDDIINNYVEEMERYEKKQPVLDEIKKIEYHPEYDYLNQRCTIRKFNGEEVMYFTSSDSVGDLDIYKYDKDKTLSIYYMYKTINNRYKIISDNDDF